MRLSRRRFLLTSAGLAAGSAFTLTPGLSRVLAAGSKAASTYRRYNVASPQGQRMLGVYARGVQAMLDLPPADPLNWFRNAFVHFLDCPHGNWWFYVWHRGFIGLMEQKIRRLTNEPDFTLPFWDWTANPQFPATMFEGVLSPTAASFAAYAGSLERFTAFIQPSMRDYWARLSPDQLKQLQSRGYDVFDDFWNDVTGYDPVTKQVDPGNQAFAQTDRSRYPTKGNPGLDARTAYAVSSAVVGPGLTMPSAYYDADLYNSFVSNRTESHDQQPHAPKGSRYRFSILEGFPHNKLHNFIGGVGPLDPGPYGNMTNFLSPVDPIFFLHHANMDRLWDVWTRRQQALGLPTEPVGADRPLFMNERLLFFVDAQGQPVNARAEDYFLTSAFAYDYAPGFGEDLVNQPLPSRSGRRQAALRGSAQEGVVRLDVPVRGLQGQLAARPDGALVVEVTVQRPAALSAVRDFDILVNAPAGLATAAPGSPYYGGTVAFIGPAQAHGPAAHHGPADAASEAATFVVPLPRTLALFNNLKGQSGSISLEFRAVPSTGAPAASALLQSVVIPMP